MSLNYRNHLSSSSHSNDETIKGEPMEKGEDTWSTSSHQIGSLTQSNQIYETGISLANEELFIKRILEMIDKGIQLTFHEICKEACLCDTNFKKYIGTDDSFTWWNQFKVLHPEISRVQKSTITGKTNALLRRVFHLHNFYQHPERIYNCTEVVIDLSKNSKVFIPLHRPKKKKTGISFSGNRTSVHFCASGSGKLLPPLIIFKDHLPNGTFAQDGPDEALYWVNPSGLSDPNCFLRWFSEVFLKYSQPLDGEPVLLLLQDTAIYQNPKLINCAQQNNVILMLLKSNKSVSHYHPLDFGLFAALEKRLQFLSRIGRTDAGLWIKQDDLPAEIGRIFQDRSLDSEIKLGFKETGFSPFDSNLLEKKSQWSAKRVITKCNANQDGKNDELPSNNQALRKADKVQVSHSIFTQEDNTGSVSQLSRSERLKEAFKLVNKGIPIIKAAKFCRVSKMAVNLYLKEERTNSISNVSETDLELPREVRLEKAVSLVKSGVKIAAAARSFNVARSTLHRYLTRGMPQSPKQKLTKEMKLEKAFDLVKSGRNVDVAAKTFGLATSTLIVYMKKNIAAGDPYFSMSDAASELQSLINPFMNSSDLHNVEEDHSAEMVLPEIEEADLLEHLECMLRIGYPRIKEDIPMMVQHILDSKDLRIFGEENIPSSMWVSDFLDQNRFLLNELDEMSKCLKSTAPKNIIKHFRKLESILENEHLLNARDFFQPDNGDQIFTCDQIDFSLSMVDAKMDAFLCISASGLTMKPLLINSRKMILQSSEALGTVDAFYKMESPTGTLDSGLFMDWLESCFVPFLSENDIETPVVLLLNGAKIPLSLSSLLFAQERGIVLFCLPANNVQQPLASAYFPALKDAYNKLATKQVKIKDISKCIPYQLIEAMKQVKQQVCIHGFKMAHLVPYDIESIMQDGSSPKRSKKSKSNSRRNKFDDSIEPGLSSEEEFDFLGFSDAETLNRNNNENDMNENEMDSSESNPNTAAPTVDCDDIVTIKEKLHYLVGCFIETKESLKRVESIIDPDNLADFKLKFEKKIPCQDDLYALWEKVKSHLTEAEERLERFLTNDELSAEIKPFDQTDLATLINFSSTIL